MLQTIQEFIGHDAFGAVIFLILVGYAITFALPREWQTFTGWMLAAAIIGPVGLLIVTVLKAPFFLIPIAFLFGILCAGKR